MPTIARERQWLVLGVLCIAVFLVVVDNTIVNVALPSLSRDLHASNTSLQWIVDGYSLPFAGLLLAGAGLADRFGRKKVMLWGLVAFALVSLLAAFSRDIQSLLTARALMGASAAFIFPATLSILTEVFEDPRDRAKAFGLWGATSGVAIAFGPIAGGALITHFWYGSIFLVNVPLVLLGLFAIGLIVPESKAPDVRRFDLSGLLLGTIGVASLILAIIQGPSWGWRSPATIGLFVTSGIMLTLFTIFELRRENPLLDVRVFNSREFSAGAGAIAVNFFCLFGFIFLITQYFQLVRGYSAFSAGVHTLPFALAVVIATPLGALAALVMGARYVVALGLLVTSIALWGTASLSWNASYAGHVVGLMVVFAIGFSLVNAPSTSVLMETLTPEQIGGGVAVNETTRELGGTMGVAIIGSVFSSLFGPEIRRALAPFLSKGLTVHQLDLAQSSMQAARAAVARLPVALQSTTGTRVTGAFMNGLHHSCLVGAAVALATALIVFVSLPGGRVRRVQGQVLEV